MDLNVKAKIDCLYFLSSKLLDDDTFVRLTAYAVLETVIKELQEIALDRGYPIGNINGVLMSIKYFAGALAGTMDEGLGEKENHTFYLQEIQKLDDYHLFGNKELA